MKKYTDFLFEELEDKDTRTLKWIRAESDGIKDYFSNKFDTETYYSDEFGGIIIVPDKDLIEMTPSDKEEFADLFGRELSSIFPYKYSIEKNGEKLIVVSPFKEGIEIPQLAKEE